MKPLAAAWRLVLSMGLTVALIILIANVITQPVEVATRSYDADFTDASGLHVGADVRVRGVRVGKVDSVELQRKDGNSIAAIGFTLDKQYGVVPRTRLAIKFQALTGLRYMDVVNPSENEPATSVVSHVPIAMTQPSFDITALFNGLQPVIATLSPEEINTFTDNASSFLTGDGTGLAPVLDSMRKFTEFLSNRQQVVATLMQNLYNVANTIGGHSKDLLRILDWANRPIDGALEALDEFRKSQLYGPEFTKVVVRLLDNSGFTKGTDIDSALDRAFTNLDDAVTAFKLVPVMWDNIAPPVDDGTPEPCSRGNARLPGDLDVLLNGQRVVLCNR